MHERLDRRQFMGRVIAGGIAGKLAAVVGCSSDQSRTGRKESAAARQKPSVTDVVPLGNSGVRITRLGMGTGMKGWNRSSNQTKLGMEGLTNLFRYVYDRGIRHLDLADMYGSHEYVKNFLKYVPRDRITILTKTVTRDAAGVRKDLERFRQEIGTDYIDVVLLHCVTDGDWPVKLRGCMEVLEEAKQKGLVRAHGVSCHTLAALKAAAATPWVEVDLARFNPRGVKMDGTPDEVIPVVESLHARGAGVIGMKIIGEGTFKDGDTIDESLRFVLAHACVDAFIIGFEKAEEVDDILKRCSAILA